jgi:hypothetical protein
METTVVPIAFGRINGGAVAVARQVITILIKGTKPLALI